MYVISVMASKKGSPKEYLLNSGHNSFVAGKEFYFRHITYTSAIRNMIESH